MTNHSRRRIPKLRFTKLRGIGWHVAFRDPHNGSPRRIRFGNIEKAEVETKYHAWLAEHLNLTNGNGAVKPPEKKLPPATAHALQIVVPGSLLSVATRVFEFDEYRTRKPGEPRATGTLESAVAAVRGPFRGGLYGATGFQ